MGSIKILLLLMQNSINVLLFKQMLIIVLFANGCLLWCDKLGYKVYRGPKKGCAEIEISKYFLIANLFHS